MCEICIINLEPWFALSFLHKLFGYSRNRPQHRIKISIVFAELFLSNWRHTNFPLSNLNFTIWHMLPFMTIQAPYVVSITVVQIVTVTQKHASSEKTTRIDSEKSLNNVV